MVTNGWQCGHIKLTLHKSRIKKVMGCSFIHLKDRRLIIIGFEIWFIWLSRLDCRHQSTIVRWLKRHYKIALVYYIFKIECWHLRNLLIYFRQFIISLSLIQDLSCIDFYRLSFYYDGVSHIYPPGTPCRDPMKPLIIIIPSRLHWD